MERRPEGYPLAQTFQPVMLGLADFIAVKIKHALAIIAFDGEYLGKDRLQTHVLPLGWRGVGLQEFPIGIGLQFDKIGRGYDLFDLSEVDTFCCFRWHDYLWVKSGLSQGSCFKRQKARSLASRKRAGSKILLLRRYFSF